jgi:hypothetical protein
VTVPVRAGRYTLVDTFGQFQESVAAGSNGLLIKATGFPQYLVPGKPR